MSRSGKKTAGRILRAAAATTTVALCVATAPAARADEDVDRSSPYHHGTSPRGAARTGGVRGAATVVDLTPSAALATLNAARARYGTPSLELDTAITTALDNHARYISLNAEVDDDLYTEEPSRPGYTAAGAEIAPYAEPVWTGTLRGLVDSALGDPFLRTAMVLEESGTSIGFGAHGGVRVLAMQFTGEPPTGYPRTFPRGANNTTLAHQVPWLGSLGCTGRGFPITGALDYSTHGLVTASSGRLQADGATVSACTVAPGKLPDATLAMVPAAALKPGTHYSGSFTASVNLLGGGSRQVSLPVDFTTAAPATRIAGDQTGDRAADVFAILGGDLYLYKGRSNGTLGHGWKVGRGWASTNWISLVGDVNKDGRSDLLARRADGTLWQYLSRGMGGFASGRQVGRGWSGLSLLTVVGDMDGDGTQELVGRTADGSLLRYRVGVGISGRTKIGTGWTGMSYLAGPGSMNGDGRADILAVRSDGVMFTYPSDALGRPTAPRKVGHGWTGWTALVVPGDLNGDGRLDLMGRRPDGVLQTYLNRGTSWGPGVRAGVGFAPFTALS